MDALVHFAVGLTGGLLVLLAVDLPPREEFALAFASGAWALVPDGHWMLSEFGFPAPAATWKGLHATPLADAFWFHRTLDLGETGRPLLEQGAALGLLSLAVAAYYVGNDWSET